MKMTRAEARRRGLVRYDTGEYCRNGHRSERYTATGKCVTCVWVQRIRRKQRNPREFLKKNREAAKRYRSKYEENKAWQIQQIYQARAGTSFCDAGGKESGDSEEEGRADERPSSAKKPG